MNVVTTFPSMAEFEKVKIRLDELGLKYTLIDPGQTYSSVGLDRLHEIKNGILLGIFNIYINK
jgi:hypothetical protein